MIYRSKAHLAKNKMTYFGHMRFASFYGVVCIRAGILLLIHSLIPGLYERAGSKLVRRLKQVFDRHELEKRERVI